MINFTLLLQDVLYANESIDANMPGPTFDLPMRYSLLTRQPITVYQMEDYLYLH